jgi:hypothetical protein
MKKEMRKATPTIDAMVCLSLCALNIWHLLLQIACDRVRFTSLLSHESAVGTVLGYLSEGAFLLNNYCNLFPLGWAQPIHSSGVNVLPKENLGFSMGLLLAVLVFLGATLSACVTVPKAPETTELSVSFMFTGQYDSVCLSGDFNGWSSDSHCLQRKGDKWSIQLALPPGSYRYGFVTDKKDWVCDPEALIQEDDGFGRKNSVLLIDPAVTKRLSGS